MYKTAPKLFLRALFGVLFVFAVASCDLEDTHILNTLDVPVKIEIKTATGETLSETIEAHHGFGLPTASEANGKRFIVSCRIEAERKSWTYSPSDIARLSGGRPGIQSWTIGPDGLSRK